MKAMVLKKISRIEDNPLEMTDIPDPKPNSKEILVKISVCGICHTELHQIEGKLTPSELPRVLGHQIVGKVEEKGKEVAKFEIGDRVGIAWIYSSCGRCDFCLKGMENLCEQALFTGHNVNGGYAQYMVVSEDFAYRIPDRFSDLKAAPLLCAGVIGFRALRLSGIKPGEILGLYGFGASAHIVIQVAKYWNCKVFVFSRSKEHRDLAKRLGADWTGEAKDEAPSKLNAAIDFAPAGWLVPEALGVLERGGRLVLAEVRMYTPIPDLDYTKHLYYEKEIKSVANVTRNDAEDFLPLAAEIPILPEVQEFELEQANQALNLLKQGKIQGAGVLKIPDNY
jgi:propanol-preferring alcohol dehydrogenase